MKRQQEGTLEGLKAVAAYARQHPEMDEMKIMKMLIDYCISIGDAKAESMSQEELFTGLTNFIASKKNESTKGKSMKKLTERELNVLEALMAKQAKAKKLGKVLSLQERVVLGKLKAALKRQFESSDDGFGMDFPNEEEMGYEDLIDPEGQTELNGPNGMESNMGMHSGMSEKAKALKIKRIKEKILASRKSRIKEEGDYENQYNDKEDINDQMAEEEDMAQDAETIANAFRMVADQLEDEAVSNKDVEGMEGEEMADEDMEDEDFLESVRNRVKNRRAKLAGLRKSVMSEGDKGEAGDTDTGLPDMYLGLAAEIGKNPDTITRQQVEARKAKINSIKEKIARAKREAEVKTYGTGKLKTDVEAVATENVEDFEKKPYAGKKQKTGATKHTGLTEKLDFESLLAHGLLG